MPGYRIMLQHLMPPYDPRTYGVGYITLNWLLLAQLRLA